MVILPEAASLDRSGSRPSKPDLPILGLGAILEPLGPFLEPHGRFSDPCRGIWGPSADVLVRSGLRHPKPDLQILILGSPLEAILGVLGPT